MAEAISITIKIKEAYFIYLLRKNAKGLSSLNKMPPEAQN
jgi:hypothetical protein